MSNTALLLMDLQNGIVGMLGGDTSLVTRAGEVAAAARKANIPVIHVVVKFRADFPEVSDRNQMFGRIKSMGPAFTEGNPATEVHELVKVQPSDVLVTKRRVGAFSGSDLDVVLRSKNIDHIVLGGIATSGVVLSTLRLASDLDYKITVLSDLCKDRDDEVHRVLIEKVFPNQAEVNTSNDWVASL